MQTPSELIYRTKLAAGRMLSVSWMTQSAIEMLKVHNAGCGRSAGGLKVQNYVIDARHVGLLSFLRIGLELVVGFPVLDVAHGPKHDIQPGRGLNRPKVRMLGLLCTCRCSENQATS